MNEKIMPGILIKNETKNSIYEIRGTYVMLDSDVASAFNVDTSQLNRQMKRNISRFPEDFCFQLNSREFKNLRCQNGTFKLASKGRKHTPHMYMRMKYLKLYFINLKILMIREYDLWKTKLNYSKTKR